MLILLRLRGRGPDLDEAIGITASDCYTRGIEKTLRHRRLVFNYLFLSNNKSSIYQLSQEYLFIY